jgi:hypothetical protein
VELIPRPEKVKDMNELLRRSARGGNVLGCGAREWGEMLCSAAEGGHESLCRVAREWGATDWNAMLLGVAHGGHENLCCLVREGSE